MIYLLSFFACADEEKPFNHFADVANPTLVVNAGDIPPRGARLQVLVHPELGGLCRELPELRADVDGVPLTRLHGKYDDGSYAYDRDCNVYEFAGDAALLAKLPPRPDNVVTVTDGVTTLSLTAVGLFTKPLLSAPPGPIPAGSPVTLAWAQPGDTVDATVPISVRLTPESGEVTAGKELKATGTAITFTLPEGVVGAVAVDLLGTLAFTPTVTQCVGAVHCQTSRGFFLDTLKLDVKPADGK